MSEQKTAQKASEKQIETITSICQRLFRGSASSVISLSSNYAFLNAFGKGDKELAATELNKMIDKNTAERVAYKASHPSTGDAPALDA